MMEIEQIPQYIGRRVRVVGGIQEAEGVLQGFREVSHPVRDMNGDVVHTITDAWVLTIDGKAHQFGPMPEFEPLD